MGLFKRISDNIRANLNALLDQAEDPERMLDQYLRDMEEDITDAEGAVAKQLAIARKFKAQYDEAVAATVKREDQALEALKRGREDLAKRALQVKKEQQAISEEHKKQYESSNTIAEQLKGQLKEMKEEFEKMRIKRDTLVARVESAKAKKKIQSAVSGLGKDSSRREFERIEEKVLLMEAENEVAFELDGAIKDLDKELEALQDDEVELELARLKESLKR